MPLFGTIVNGEVRLDEPAKLPEGSRVTVILGEEDDFGPVPVATESHAEFMASLRESIAETNAGVRGRSVDEVFDDLDREIRGTAMDKE
jgi:hypothetical protein